MYQCYYKLTFFAIIYRKGWMTSATFKDWYLNCFIPTVKRYCAEKNIAFKILLLLDNAPSHPDLSNLCENVKIMFFPPNVTSLIQPMVCIELKI